MKKKSISRSKYSKVTNFFIITSILVGVIFVIFYFSNFSNKKEVVARVGEENIYKTDVESKLNEIFQNSRNSSIQTPNLSEVPQEILKIVLREIYTDKKILAKAKKVGIDKKKEVKQKIAQVKKAIINQGYIDYIIENEVNDQVISETYVNLSNQINGKKEYDFSHIVVKEESLANDIYKNLSRNPKNFAQQAKKYSLDTESGKNGGKIGFVIETAISPEISDSLPNLKINEISKPIKTNFGWHIVRYSDVRDAKPLALEAVRNNIKSQLIQEKISNLKNNLFNNAKIEILIESKSDNEMNSLDNKDLEIEENPNDLEENEEFEQNEEEGL